MSRSSSPALRSLQITTNGKTLVGRSPNSKLIERERSSPSVKKDNVKENVKSSRKITSYFPKAGTKALKELNEAPAIKETKEKITLKVPIIRIDAGENTELELAPAFNDEKIIREKLYSTGPKLYDSKARTWKPYWEMCAKDVRQRLNDALLEKLACDDEIESLLEEKRKLQEELENYKEYFDLREYSESVCGGEESN